MSFVYNPFPDQTTVGSNPASSGGSSSPSTIYVGQGLSAYQVAVNNGFSGTEQDWLNSLRGASGSVSPFPPTASTDFSYNQDGTVSQVMYYSGGHYLGTAQFAYLDSRPISVVYTSADNTVLRTVSFLYNGTNLLSFSIT